MAQGILQQQQQPEQSLSPCLTYHGIAYAVQKPYIMAQPP
jgi:hypothetical protein